LEVREIGQTARLLSRFLADFIREEGGDERRNATWSVRPADAKAGFSSVVLVDSLRAVPCRHEGPIGYWPDQFRESALERGTPVPGIDHVSPDWKHEVHLIARVFRAATILIIGRRHKRHPRATSHHSARSPVLFLSGSCPLFRSRCIQELDVL
jgi:hypothetical protein